MTTTSQRLQAVSRTLQERGVLDVKFYFERGTMLSVPSSTVVEKVADLLECYVAGKGTVATSFGDRV